MEKVKNLDVPVFENADLERTDKILGSDSKHNSLVETLSKAWSKPCENPKHECWVPNHDHGFASIHETRVGHTKISGRTPSKPKKTRALKSKKILRSSPR